MVTPSPGSVVLIPFPFSDLSQSKLRPAVVIAAAGNNDWVLCQITSNPYSDSRAVQITNSDFDGGGLRVISFVRPGKLFTAHASLFSFEAGKLGSVAYGRVVDAVVALLRAQV